jgi:hypothetical protein
LGRFGLLPVLERIAREVNGRVITRPIPRDLLKTVLEWEIDTARRIVFNWVNITPESVSWKIEMNHIMSRPDLWAKTEFMFRRH